MINLADKKLGRASSEIAKILIGKNDANFSYEKDIKNYVIAINAKQIVLTGNKAQSKRYYRHSGYIGNIKINEFKDMFSKSPEKVIVHSVAGMLPKNTLRDARIKRLKVYSGEEHPHKNVNEIINI